MYFHLRLLITQVREWGEVVVGVWGGGSGRQPDLDIRIDAKLWRRKEKKDFFFQKSADASLILTHREAIKASHFARSAFYFRAISTLGGGEQDEAAAAVMTTAGDLPERERVAVGGGRSMPPPPVPSAPLTDVLIIELSPRFSCYHGAYSSIFYFGGA